MLRVMKRGMQGEASTAAPGPGSSHDEAKCTARSTTIRPSTGGLSQPAFAGLHRPRQRALLAELSRWHQWSRARYRRPRAGASASAYARWQQHFGQRPRSWLTCGRGNRRAACPEPRAKQWSAATAAKETAGQSTQTQTLESQNTAPFLGNALLCAVDANTWVRTCSCCCSCLAQLVFRPYLRTVMHLVECQPAEIDPPRQQLAGCCRRVAARESRWPGPPALRDGRVALVTS
eukprot:COSAG06_NODE_1529_length_9182_cov_66.881694_3_plen_233_part_00